MANLEPLYKYRGMTKSMEILLKAAELAKTMKEIGPYELQNELKLGYEEATIVMDWLADTHAAEPRISEHWIRKGRAYVLNSPFPSLTDMIRQIGIGEKRGMLIMHELERRGIIRIRANFEFERVGRMSSFKDLVRQMRVIGKKYKQRCEPGLLQRTMFVDAITAMRLAQYGEEFLGFKWKNRDPSVL